ncbi:Imm8 family immunity protein [Chromobacterium violaceum]|uniref:Imm8 family immunity protein n=1 Tax=Chromobacterium violaceum TaxID=536 RepID=UPI0035A612BC
MKANIKSVDLGGVCNVEGFAPEDPYCFSLWLVCVIGAESSAGGDCFRVNVCTPNWLQAAAKIPTWGRYMLIVNKYDFPQIRQAIEKALLEVDEPDWDGVARKVSRVMEWEFEDYVN